MGLVKFKSIFIIFHWGLDTIFTTSIFQTGPLSTARPFLHPRKYSYRNISARKEWQHLNLLQRSVRVACGGKQVCEEGCAVRAAGTAIHLLFHLQGNVRSWQKGFTPRHYFRHNIRPMHTIKQWQHLNSHRTSTYPFSLNNESEEEATGFFFFFPFFLQLRTTYRNNGEKKGDTQRGVF